MVSCLFLNKSLQRRGDGVGWSILDFYLKWFLQRCKSFSEKRYSAEQRYPGGPSISVLVWSPNGCNVWCGWQVLKGGVQNSRFGGFHIITTFLKPSCFGKDKVALGFERRQAEKTWAVFPGPLLLTYFPTFRFPKTQKQGFVFGSKLTFFKNIWVDNVLLMLKLWEFQRSPEISWRQTSASADSGRPRDLQDHAAWQQSRRLQLAQVVQNLRFLRIRV